MKFLSTIAVVVVFLLTLQLADSYGQIQLEVEQSNIDEAESLAADWVAMRDDLPSRWAARQRRRTVNFVNLAESAISVTRIEELWAHDKEADVTYTRCTHGDPRRGNPFDMEVLSRDTPKQKLFKLGEKPWEEVAKIPNTPYDCAFPLWWSLGWINSARSGSMHKADYLTLNLSGHGRACFAARHDKEGNLVSFWGNEKRKPRYVTKIVFSKSILVPLEYAMVAIPSGVAFKKSVAERKYSILEQGHVTWKPFPEVQRDGKAMLLPVHVEVQSVLNPGEELDCVNDIEWLFGKAVPQTVFADPLKAEIVEPEFD
ncbi:MAG: hypothetical protein R3C53_08905 [Pirellulaceae bacterium]